MARDLQRVNCPVCGIEALRAVLPSHVGSARCLTRLAVQLRGKHHDRILGPRVEEAARAIDEMLRSVPGVD
jgi:hypothetical protein